MPTYEYECLKCGRKFDHFQKMTDQPLEKCGSCPGRVRRLVSAGAGVIYRGAGFYTTEYRSESYRKKAREECSKTGSAGSSCPAEGACGSGKCPA